jgi:hypothetical protein
MTSLSRRIVLGLTTTVVCLLSVPAVAGATGTIDHFSLDSYHAWYLPHTPPATSNVALRPGLYVAVVQGTFSYWTPKNYSHPRPTLFHPWTIVCGTPEPEPEFASAGGSGPVGLDAEFIFSRPWTPRKCAADKLPAKWSNFQMYTGLGSTWTHPTALNLSTPAAPNPSHTYEYPIKETSGYHHVSFRLADIDTRDNYGSLQITLRAATPSDCAGSRYVGFGLTSAAQCVSMTTP